MVSELLTYYNHGCHWTAEWSCAGSAMLCCHLNTVLCKHCQPTDGMLIGGNSCLNLRAAACSRTISYGVVEHIPIPVPARWGAPPDQDGGRSSGRGIDKLGSTSGGWRPAQSDRASHTTHQIHTKNSTTVLTGSLCHSHSSNRIRSKSFKAPGPHTDTIGCRRLEVSKGVLGNAPSLQHLPPSLEFRT